MKAHSRIWRQWLSVSLVVFAGWSLFAAHENVPPHSFAVGQTEFQLDGKPFLIRCGELHFARIPRPYWRHRLRMCRAMGLNAVCAYLFWNYHEMQPGVFDFSGEKDVAAFCRMAQEEGLWVLLRPGPYVCAEWDFGGLPWWLLANGEESVRVRTSDPKFLEPAKRYLRRVGQELAGLQVTHGGPILMTQVENEYGAFGDDSGYVRALADATREAGFDVPLFACNGPEDLPYGRVEGLFDVVNFGSDPEASFRELRKFRKKGPLMNGEYYPGWFDSWGEAHHRKSSEKILAEVRWMLEHRASFSIYMAHGGTTFGWWAGANTPYLPETSSYDYEAPISESGEATDKFFRIREICGRHLNAGESLPSVPSPIPHAGFVVEGRAAVAELRGSAARPLVVPTTFERLGFGYGVAVFRRDLPPGAAAPLTCADIRDHAAVLVDGRLVGFLDRRYPKHKVGVPASRSVRRLTLVVAAMGRFNYGHEGLSHNAKGVAAEVLLDGRLISGGWTAEAYPFADFAGKDLLSFGSEKPLSEVEAPAASAVRIRFTARGGVDTWLDAGGWPFGVVWINGHPLGRYWAIGPTRTMYVPGCWLRDGENELIVWDLKGFPACEKLTFLDHPILDELHPERDLADFSGTGRRTGEDSAAAQIKSNLSE